MGLVPTKEKIEGLTGNCHLRRIYEQENFLTAWYMDFRFKIQRANKASPVGSLLLPEPETDIQWQQRPTEKTPKYLQQCCEDQALCCSSEMKAEQEQQFKDGEVPVGKPEGFQQCQHFFLPRERFIHRRLMQIVTGYLQITVLHLQYKVFLVLVRTNLFHIVASRLCCLPPTS